MLAVMTRATRGHTGRKLKSSRMTNASYVVLAFVALLRPLAEIAPSFTAQILLTSAIGWMAALAMFAFEHAPMLCTGRKPLTVRGK